MLALLFIILQPKVTTENLHFKTKFSKGCKHLLIAKIEITKYCLHQMCFKM